MNAVAQKMAAGELVFVPAAAGSGVLSELEAFIAIDPLLASLHKQYTGAQALSLKSAKEHGTDAAMTEMAMAMEESCHCALQTRLLELRRDESAARAAEVLLREAQVEEEKAQAQDSRAALSLEEFRRMEFFAEMAARKKGAGGSAIFMALWFLVLSEKDRLARHRDAMMQFNRRAAAA